MSVQVIDTLAGFLALRDEWNVLLERSRMSSPFLIHQWLEAWWRGYAGDGDRLQVVCVRDEGTQRLIGVLPACVQRCGGLIPSQRMRFMGDGLGAAQLDSLIDPDFETEVLEAFHQWLRSNEKKWDVLEFRRLDEHSPFLGMLHSAFSGTGGGLLEGVSASCPVAILPDTWEEYLQGLSRRERGRVKRWRRELDEAGAVAIERVETRDGLDSALLDALQMFEAGMSVRYGRPYATSQRYREFLHSVSEGLLDRGQLRFVFLTVDGQRIAFILQVRHGHTMFGYKTAFDESWGSHHAGLVLFGYALEEAIAEGCSVNNFGVGVSEYKRRFSEGVAEMREVTYYDRSLAGRMCAAHDRTRGALTAFLKQHAPKPVIERLEQASARANLDNL